MRGCLSQSSEISVLLFYFMICLEYFLWICILHNALDSAREFQYHLILTPDKVNLNEGTWLVAIRHGIIFLLLLIFILLLLKTIISKSLGMSTVFYKVTFLKQNSFWYCQKNKNKFYCSNFFLQFVFSLCIKAFPIICGDVGELEKIRMK